MNRNVNPAIPESMQAYELECRVAGQESLWDRLLQLPEDGTADDRAFATAYVVRFHMVGMQQSGILDLFFVQLCAELKERNEYELFQQYLNVFLGDEKIYNKVAYHTAPFIVLKGDARFGDILGQFADDVTEALQILGEDVIELGTDGTQRSLNHRMLCKGIVGFQSPALENDLFRAMQGPKFQFWFDNPVFFEGMLQNLPSDYYLLCQDADYAGYARRYFEVPNALQFFPGGREGVFEETDRPVDLLFLGGWFPEDHESLNHDERVFYDYMLLHPCDTYEKGLLELEPALAERPPVEIRNRLCQLRNACSSVRGHFRNEIVRILLEGGIPVEVYGDRWKQFELRGKHYPPGLIMHPQVSVRDSADIYRHAKISLNVMSWHKAGMTERIANSMLGGAVCLSEKTDYLSKNLRDGEEIVLFRLDELERLPEIVKGLLNDDERRKRIAENGYKLAMERFSWKARTEELIRLAEDYWEGTET